MAPRRPEILKLEVKGDNGEVIKKLIITEGVDNQKYLTISLPERYNIINQPITDDVYNRLTQGEPFWDHLTRADFLQGGGRKRKTRRHRKLRKTRRHRKHRKTKNMY